jgi:UDP-MurNAc hydroxylase
MPWLEKAKAEWHEPTPNLIEVLREWWEPLLAMAPTLRGGVGSNCLLRTGDLDLLIDFPAGEVRPFAGEPYRFSFDIPRELVETVAAARAVDWSNSLFLSCRFRAWRDGAFNEHLYNFFKSLSVERMRRAEAEALRRLDPDRGGMAGEEIRIGDYVCQRTCPHRQADLTVFGEIEGDELVCTLHGWRFDLATGECLSAEGERIRIRRADAPA